MLEVFLNHPLYPDFLQVQSRLRQHQFVCWLAGGAVRDFYLGRLCDDFDLVTDASTENLKVIFPEALLVGEKFGVLKLVLKNGKYFDLTTFRQESDYVDGRRPSAVSASTPLQDALRRDFTINALFFDPHNQTLVDYVGGVADLDQKRLMAVGQAATRFQEDYLRILRLVRFASQLNFQIEELTEKSAAENIEGLHKVSGERIWTELKKIEKASAWNYAIKNLLFKQIISFEFKISWNFKMPPSPFLSASDSSFHLFYFLANLQIEQAALKECLKKRFHLSKDEIKMIEFFLYIETELKTFEIEFLAQEIEGKKELQNVLIYLVEQQKFDQIKFEKALNILEVYPEHLIKGQDLIGVIEASQIKKALQSVRLKQFKGLLKNKNEAFDSIKKDFATSS